MHFDPRERKEERKKKGERKKKKGERKRRKREKKSLSFLFFLHYPFILFLSCLWLLLREKEKRKRETRNKEKKNKERKKKYKKERERRICFLLLQIVGIISKGERRRKKPAANLELPIPQVCLTWNYEFISLVYFM